MGVLNEENQFAALRLWKKLYEDYGTPWRSASRMPTECKGQLITCLKTDEARLEAMWIWPKGHRIEAKILRKGEDIYFIVNYRLRMRKEIGAAIEDLEAAIASSSGNEVEIP